jgi:hypothetical protein
LLLLSLSLSGFAKCFSLVYLDVSSNQIAEVSEVGHLAGLPLLEELYLQGNPIRRSSSYRSAVLSHLPASADKISLDGKKASQGELELSASLGGVKGHRRVASRTADIKPDKFSPASQEAQEELEVSTGVTSRLEEMRKTGGDKWLALLNSDRSRGSPGSPGDDVVAQERGKERKRKHRKHQNHPPSESENDSAVSVEQQGPSAAPVVSGNPFPVEPEGEEEEEPSRELQTLIQQLQSEKLHLSDFPVTVLEYGGPLDSLSAQDVDQKLRNSRLEECSVCVDTSVMRLLETVLSTSRTRCQRDLALLEDIRFHEGRKKGVCLRFAQFSGSPLWVIYCVRDLGALARLYVAVQQALKTRESSQEAAAPGVLTPPPEVNIVEEVDSSPAATLSQALTDPLAHPPEPAAAVAEVKAHSPDPLSPVSSELPSPQAALASGQVSPAKTQSRSRSPSPKPSSLSSKWAASGGSSPVLPGKSAGKGSGLEVKKESKGTASAPVSLAPSPVTAPRRAAGAEGGDGRREGEAKKTVSGEIQKTRMILGESEPKKGDSAESKSKKREAEISSPETK